MKIFGIETSCDETAAAIVENGTTIVSSVVASSSKLHRKFGGIVPEVAARKQIELMPSVLSEAMQSASEKDIDAIAVTVGPGLIGSLLVGVETAKTLALSWNKPIIPVNHVHAHVYSNFIDNGYMAQLSNGSKTIKPSNHIAIEFPAISLVASGGHTELFFMKDKKSLKWLGGTIDDAAGEAFDKTARLLGFENRGGPAIAATAEKFGIRHPTPPAGRPTSKIKLPRPIINDGSCNFSFSGLKTAALREVEKLKSKQQFDHVTIQQLAFEVQEAIVDVLVAKTLTAAKEYKACSILLSGGVAANKRLREKFNQSLIIYRLPLSVPEAHLCTDNAAAIAACAYFHNKPQPWQDITARPNLSVEV